MTRCSWPAGILAIVLLPAFACAAEVSDPLFAQFEGVWKNEITLKTPATPEGKKGTNTEVFQRALKGKYLICREAASAGSEKSLFLVRYDPVWNRHLWTFFNTTDLYGAEWKGMWDASTNTFNSKSNDCPDNWTSSGVNKFLTKDSAESTAWMKDDKGNLIFEMSLKKTRQPAEVGEKMLAGWKEPADPKAELSPELKVLDQFAGTWDVVGVMKKAEWTPEEKTVKSKVVREWILNRKFLQDTSTNEDGTESIALFTYEPTHEKAYRSWWFNSEGHENRSTGQWDAASKTLNWEMTLADITYTAKGSTHVTDADHQEWRTRVTDIDGKLLFDGTWTCVRAK